MIDVCGICLDEYTQNINVKLEPCNHIFHKHCIIDLYKFNRLPTCPYCRSNIIDIIEQDTECSLFLDILSTNIVSSDNYFDLYNQHFEEIQQELDLNEMLLGLLNEYIPDNILEEFYFEQEMPIYFEDIPEEYEYEYEYVDDFEIYETTINEIYGDVECSSNEDTNTEM